MERSGPDQESGSVQIITDPDPGGPKTTNPTNPEHKFWSKKKIFLLSFRFSNTKPGTEYLTYRYILKFNLFIKGLS